jgi:hypothetical protein
MTLKLTCSCCQLRTPTLMINNQAVCAACAHQAIDRASPPARVPAREVTPQEWARRRASGERTTAEYLAWKAGTGPRPVWLERRSDYRRAHSPPSLPCALHDTLRVCLCAR